jgi:hypothetical protein
VDADGEVAVDVDVGVAAGAGAGAGAGGGSIGGKQVTLVRGDRFGDPVFQAPRGAISLC